MKYPKPNATASFSVKGQIVIPQWLRQAYEIREGTQAYVVGTDQGILIKPLTPKLIRGMRGSLKSSRALRVLQEERRKEREL